MRAFVAISLPPGLREDLAAYAADAARDLDGRAMPAENLHATVHFLGSVDDADAGRLEAVLAAACAGVRPFSIAIGEPAFAPRRRPRMIWARLEAPPELAEVAQLVAAAAEPFAPKARAPRTENPHVTLARLPRPPPRSAELGPLPRAGTEVAVAECALVRSQLGRGGARYTTLATLPLGAG